jgi:hypothetical protein
MLGEARRPPDLRDVKRCRCGTWNRSQKDFNTVCTAWLRNTDSHLQRDGSDRGRWLGQTRKRLSPIFTRRKTLPNRTRPPKRSGIKPVFVFHDCPVDGPPGFVRSVVFGFSHHCLTTIFLKAAKEPGRPLSARVSKAAFLARSEIVPPAS